MQLRDVIRRGDVKLAEVQSQIEELQEIQAELQELRSRMVQRLLTIDPQRGEPIP
jgi:hypothetical protein